MIVRRGDGVLHLITQPDHAALARRIMERWHALQGHTRRDSILLAVGEHDNGWREPDAAPAIDPATGRVHDFISAPAGTRQGVWPRGVERLSDDPWAAALVAQHAVTVYDRYRGDADWTAFFSTMEDLRDRLLARTTRARAELDRDYAFVRIGDLISLVFCNAWNEPQHYGEWTFVLDGDEVAVTPDAFGGHTIAIEIAARAVADRRFISDADLQNAIDGGPVIRLRGAVGAFSE